MGSSSIIALCFIGSVIVVSLIMCLLVALFFVSASAVVLIAITGITGYYAYSFSQTIFNMEDAIDESIGELDESYRKISKVLATPLFFDNAEVRSVLNNIDVARMTIKRIADRFATDAREDDSSENEDEI